ncbi:MAG: tetratricopeptide repeat protein [Zoogloeaceae bacterium]|jgi:tetratricopeptide (TPR) repeat protein|nr:tetratricopeptide repeat protein [Zoogloeaceae bacterium]
MRFSVRTRIPAVLMGLLLVASLPAATRTLPEVQRLIKAGQYIEALTQVDAYLAAHTRDAQGRFYKGLILTQLQRDSEAVAVFTRLTEEFPALPEPYNNLAVLYARQQQYDRARTALEKAIRTHPAYAVAYENLGDIYARMASEAYGKALQLDAANANAQNKLALIGDLTGIPGQVQAVPPPVTVTPPKVTPLPAAPAAQQADTPPAPGKTGTGAATPPATGKTTPQLPAVAGTATATAPVRLPPPEPPAPAIRANSSQELEKTVRDWAAAWSRQDINGYLAAYAPNFRTPRGISRKQWEAERRDRISRPKWIKVELSDVRVKTEGDEARVSFRQSYRASSFKGDSRKTLAFVRVGNRWLILDEDVR